MIKPKEFTVTDMDGNNVEVILSRFDAVTGREILAKYPMSNLPKVGDYQVSEETMLKLMKYVAVPARDANGTILQGVDPIMLKTRELIDNHMHDAETLMKVEMAMLEYNSSFFRKGRISDFLGEFVQMIAARIIGMSTPSSEPSSAADAPPSTN